MHLLYLDDSGSVKNPHEQYVVLGGLSIFEAQAHFITSQLEHLAESICPSDPDSVEFHASEIFSRRVDPWKKMNKNEATGVIKAVLNIFAESYDSGKAFACAVHKASLPGKDALEIAFEDLCSRFDQYLSRLHNEGNRQRGLLILDESSHETTLQGMAKNFRRLGTQWGSIKNLADIPLFVNSKASRLIQLADHISYAVFRRYNAGDASYFDIISHRFDAVDGIVHGLGHKQKYNSVCMCLSCSTRNMGKRL